MTITAEEWSRIESKTVAELADFDAETQDDQWQMSLLGALHAYEKRISGIINHPDVISYTAPHNVVTDPLLDEVRQLIGDIPNNIRQAANPSGRSRLTALIDAYV